MVLRIKNCQHYWIIGPATGTTSVGQCIYCDKKQVFSNIIPTDNMPIASPRKSIDGIGYLTYQGATYKER